MHQVHSRTQPENEWGREETYDKFAATKYSFAQSQMAKTEDEAHKIENWNEFIYLNEK